jgi:hypothetical protein
MQQEIIMKKSQRARYTKVMTNDGPTHFFYPYEGNFNKKTRKAMATKLADYLNTDYGQGSIDTNTAYVFLETWSSREEDVEADSHGFTTKTKATDTENVVWL